MATKGCQRFDRVVRRWLKGCQGALIRLFLMQWIFMHIVLKGCRPSHSNEPVHFFIAFNCFLLKITRACNEVIGRSGLDPLGLLNPHWIILLVIDRNAIKHF